MIIDIFLAIIFIGSAYLLWKAVEEKIPELIAIPDSVIEERLTEGEAFRHRVLLHIVQFRDFYRARLYQNALKKGVGKFLYRIHILLLRADNGILGLAKKALNGSNGHSAERGEKYSGNEYWRQLQED